MASCLSFSGTRSWSLGISSHRAQRSCIAISSAVLSADQSRKDRTWFFGHYEGLREVTAFSAAGYAPTAAMFGGDFRGIAETIYDPATYSAETRTRQPFPGNVIPQIESTRFRQNRLKYYLPGSSLSQTPNNIFTNPRRSEDDVQSELRVDNSFSTRQTAFAQYIRQRSTIIAPGLMPIPVRSILLKPTMRLYSTRGTHSCANQ